MLLAFKTELKLNNNQRALLVKHCGVARHAWNWGLALFKQILDYNKANPNTKIRLPSYYDLSKLIVTLVKSENPWYYEVSSKVPEMSLKHLREAWDRCFKKISKPPKFKKKGNNDSFVLREAITVIDHKRIKVPKIGILKTYERLPKGYKPKSVTIKRQANKWFISFNLETESKVNNNTSTVGVDLGVKNLATLSTGEVFEGAKSYKKYESKLKRLQYLNRNKIKDSSNYKKAQIKIAKLHKHIADIRKDTLHKLTTYLAKNHSKIVIEDLNVSGMLSNHKLAKAVSDMGFYEFRRQLEYKTKLYGSQLILADRWFPSSKLCSNCGCKKEQLSLSERVYKCEHCNFEIDRDSNAALNLAALA